MSVLDPKKYFKGSQVFGTFIKATSYLFRVLKMGPSWWYLTPGTASSQPRKMEVNAWILFRVLQIASRKGLGAFTVGRMAIGVDQLQMAPLVPDDGLLRFYSSRKSFHVMSDDIFHPG